MAWSKRELLAYLDRVEPALARLDHFEALDVPAEASAATIQAAFHHMAANLHPDLYRRVLSAEDHERLTIVYGRIAEAYRVLRNPEHRHDYLKREASKRRAGKTETAPGKTGGGDSAVARLSPKAQRLYRRAQTSLRMKDRASAKLNLRMAIALEPKSALLREALAELESE